MSSIAPPDPRIKRPGWLLGALLCALVFGASAWTEGCSRIDFYRGALSHEMIVDPRVQDAAAREEIEALYRRFGTIADSERPVVLPLAVATFVLGAALLALSARALAGRTNPRSALVQVVAVHAVVAAVSYGATRRYRDAQLDWEATQELSKNREVLGEDGYKKRAELVESTKRLAPPIGIVLRMLGSGLVLLALTRQRSRDFFEAAAARVPEP